MHTFKHLTLSLLLGAALVGCNGDGGGETETGTSGDTSTGTPDTTTGEPDPTTTNPIGTTSTGPEPTSTGPEPTSTTEPGTTTVAETETETGGDPFVFDETPPGDLVQLDRMGMPAVATALIAADLKDSYNESTPADDVSMTFVDSIVASVTGLHMALDDDLEPAFVPCDAMQCVTQGAPLVLPDTLKIDITKNSGFPNGRRLADPVIDITLAVLLLDLTTPGQSVTSFMDIPLNPPLNDKEFLAEFPYVAEPH